MTQSFARRSGFPSVVSRAAACSFLAGLAIGLTGCERADSNYAQEISEARDMMLVMTASSENRESEIQSVVSKLNNAMKDVEGDAKAPAQLMLARANSELAEIEMGRARELAAQISLALVRADAVAREYSSNRAFATTLVGPDAGQAASTIEEELRKVDSEIRSLESQKQDLNSQLSGVRSEIASVMESARAERLQEADLRDRSLDAQPMERARLIEQAVEHSRNAESFEKSASERELVVDSLELAIAQVDNFIANQQALRAIQTQGMDRINQVDNEIKQRRAARDRVTSETLDSYSSQLNEVLSLFRGDFTQAVEAAASGFSNASSTARQARAMGSLASSASGEHAAAAARVHELRGQIAQRIASSAAYLASVGATDAARFTQISGEFKGIAQEAFSAAAESYSDAAGSFSGAGAEMGSTLGEQYEARARELRGEPDPVIDEQGGDQEMPDDDMGQPEEPTQPAGGGE